MPDHSCTRGSSFQMLSEVHPYSWDSRPDAGHSHGWKKIWKCMDKGSNLPSVYCLSQNKIEQGSISAQGCRGMGVQALVPWANPGLFCPMCMMQGWQSAAAWTSASCSSLFCSEMPTRICVNLRKLVLCVSCLIQSTVCTMYYKIDLSVNDADLYHGAVCLKRTPWGDILHQVDNTVISVICVWYFWLRKG